LNKQPIISLFGPANRPWLWPRLYNSLCSNTVPFEIIFVGDKQPTFPLPDNFHFIYCEVKPSQCAEIACRYTTGDFIMPVVDDMVFSKRALDIIYEVWNSLNDDKAMVSCRYYCNDQIYTDDECRFWRTDSNTPLLPIFNLMKRKWWGKLGGIDRRFVALVWNVDIAMRMLEIGAKVFYCDEAKAVELHDKTGTNKGLRSNVGKIDRTLLDWLWARQDPLPETVSPSYIYSFNQEKGILMKNRLSPVMPFEDKHILTVSQGPKDRWK
jgi:hypothetical protein